MVKPYRIGKRKVSQEEFDAECLRLLEAGAGVVDIGRRLRRSRWPINKAIDRARARGLGKRVDEAKKNISYIAPSFEEFLKNPVVENWTRDLQALRVKTWRTRARTLFRVCESLGIYGDQLDIHYAKEWLVKEGPSLNPHGHRHFRITMRSFLKSQGVSDIELNLAGLDAKHENVGEFAHVHLTPEQENCLSARIEVKGEDVELAYLAGLDMCARRSEIMLIHPNLIVEAQGMQYVRTSIPKTKRYFTRPLRPRGIELLRKRERGFSLPEIEKISPKLKEAYKECHIEEPYAYSHPFHFLRHVGAQKYLAKFDFNRAAVCKFGGWEAEKTLEDHYGAIPEQTLLKLLKGMKW